MAKRTALLLLGTASLAACSTIVGADFDDRNLGPGSTGGGSDLNGGSSALGGQGSGGMSATTGGTSTAGTAGMNSGAGGRSTSGGTGNGTGGTAGSAGSAATSGSTVTSGGSGGTVTGQGGTTTAAGSGGQDAAGAGAGGEPQAGSGGEGGEGGVAGEGGNSAGAGGAGGDGGSGPGGPPVVVLNEIRGQGEGSDYIELYNRGPGTASLEGFRLADENNTFIFPAGPGIAANGYVILLLKQTELGGVYQCYTPNRCYHADWGVSKENGEWVYFRGPQNQVLDSIRYPAEADPGAIGDEQSLSRFPNGTGDFRATTPTPERVNNVL